MNKSIVGAWSTTSLEPNGIQTPQQAEKQKLSGNEQSKKRNSDEEPSNKQRKANTMVNRSPPTHISLALEPPKKKRKTNTVVDRSPPTHISLADLGGVHSIIDEVTDLIYPPILYPQRCIATKSQPPRGILFHGPPGCGKTLIANAFAAELGLPFIALSATSIVSGTSGESEKTLREYFEEAKKLAPCLILIDEIDAITPKRENAQGAMDRRIVAQLLTCMDDLSLEKTGGKVVIVMATTNHPDSLDPALRRGGRFSKEIHMGLPSEAAREMILRKLTRNIPIDGNLDFQQLAKQTPGFAGADLQVLVSTAGATAMKRVDDTRVSVPSIAMDLDPDMKAILRGRALIQYAHSTDPSDLPTDTLTPSDFTLSLPKIQPSSKREGFATIPEETFSSVGALKSIRSVLQTKIVAPILHPEKDARFGVSAPTGILLWGPPGCGKTLLAKAVAGESRTSFIAINGAELLNKYLGESEKAVREVFARARNAVPSLIFFDELDALAPNRDNGDGETSARVVDALLTELAGLRERKGIYVLAATNRPDSIDPAMLRAGRLEARLYVGLPGPEERVEILHTLLRNLKARAPKALGEGAEGLLGDEDRYFEGIAEVAKSCEGFSGADLKLLLEEAVCVAKGKDDGNGVMISDFWAVKETVCASVEDEERVKYEKLRKRRKFGAMTCTRRL